jgi:hypothetical protein
VGVAISACKKGEDSISRWEIDSTFLSGYNGISCNVMECNGDVVVVKM